MQHLVSSDLQRALQTASRWRRSACSRALEPVLDAALREQHFGVVEGLCVADIKAQHPQAWDAVGAFRRGLCL